MSLEDVVTPTLAHSHRISYRLLELSQSNVW